MSSQIRLVDGDEITLPEFTVDSAGHRVDLRPTVWRLHSAERSMTINWKLLPDCDENARNALRVHIVRLIERASPSYAKTTFQYIRKYLESIGSTKAPSNTVTLTSLSWYLEQLRDKRVGYQFYHIRQWIIASADRFLDGFDDEIAFSLGDLRIEGNAKGFAVLSSDPEGGPLNEYEEAALRQALLRDDGPIEQRAAVWLSLAFGTNPANLSLLRERDFTVHRFDGNTPPAYFLNMPRIKKRKAARTEFHKRYVDQPLARIIEELIARNLTNASNDDCARPLFRLSTPRPTLVAGPLREYALHFTATGITELIATCVKRLAITSPRVNGTLAVTARRLRYTFASKMVRQGTSPRDLAELLDHTDTQQVLVYYKADARFVERLDATIAQEIGPYVRGFMGRIVNGKDVTVDLIPFREVPGLGQCGASFVCGLSAPKNCYTCTKFNAFSGAPHDEVLQSLLDDRTNLIKAGQERIAEQLDLTILAVGEVVSKIKDGVPSV